LVSLGLLGYRALQLAYPAKYQNRRSGARTRGHTRTLETIFWKAGNLWKDWGNGDGHALKATLPAYRGNSHGYIQHKLYKVELYHYLCAAELITMFSAIYW